MKITGNKIGLVFLLNMKNFQKLSINDLAIFLEPIKDLIESIGMEYKEIYEHKEEYQKSNFVIRMNNENPQSEIGLGRCSLSFRNDK